MTGLPIGVVTHFPPTAPNDTLLPTTFPVPVDNQCAPALTGRPRCFSATADDEIGIDEVDVDEIGKDEVDVDVVWGAGWDCVEDEGLVAVVASILFLYVLYFRFGGLGCSKREAGNKVTSCSLQYTIYQSSKPACWCLRGGSVAVWTTKHRNQVQGRRGGRRSGNGGA